MLVTCKICKAKVEKKIAFKVTSNNKNSYYCNQNEYEESKLETESRLKVIDHVFGIIGNTTNTILMKELSDIAKVHTYNKILKYIESDLVDLNIAMDRSFNNEYGKIKYLTTIIKNKIGDFTEKVDIEEFLEIEIIESSNYTPTIRKSFAEYITEY